LAGDIRLSDAQLHRLRSETGGDLIDAMIIAAGPYAHRRFNGIAVVPVALLGP
jgi:hypothetical protein